MIKILDIPIYRCSVVFLINETKEGFLKWSSKYKEQLTDDDRLTIYREYNNPNTNGFCVSTDGGDYVARIDSKKSKGYIAHEIFHIADAILSGRNYTYGGTNEPVAYLIEYLTNEYYKMIQ